MSLTDLSLADAAAGIRRRSFTAAELLDATLTRIEAVNPKLNAFIRLEADTARSTAIRVDAGDLSGPLAGVPLAHKDMFYRAGGITTCGSKIRRDFRSDVTATVLQRLTAAGAGYLGGLNMAEFAFGPSGHNDHYGACRNPWDPTKITGGSSSGAGAATASGLTFGALGSDTGGSIRLPAGYCGLVGMKPTQTRVSRFGVMGLSFSLDNVGPLTRTVLDNALMLQAIAGADPEDPTSALVPVDDYVAAASNPAAKGVRVGVARGYFERDGEPSALAARDEAMAAMKAAGSEIVEVDVGNMHTVNGLTATTMGPEAAALHAKWMRERPEDYGEQMLARAEPGFRFSGVDYLSALQLRPKVVEDFCHRVFGVCDVLLAPTFNIEAPTIEETDVSAGQGFEAVIAKLSRCTRPLNYLTLPGLAVPTPNLVNGMPGSVQLIGKPFAEAQIYRLAAAYEAETGFSKRRPNL